MQSTSEQMEAGYKKIYRWCQFELRQYTREGQLDVSPTMREAMLRLRERSSMFRYDLFPSFPLFLFLTDTDQIAMSSRLSRIHAPPRSSKPSWTP